MSAQPLLELINVKKKYSTTEVLKGISLKVQKGDFIGIFGPSGSGKSTLLHIAGGLDTPTEGKVFLFNTRIDILPENERDKIRKGKVAYIFQFHYLLEDFTVWENIEIFAHLLGVEKKQIPSKVEKLLRFLRLEHRKNFKPSQLSGGERQRVAIARALVADPLLILADEPTGNLDSHQSEEIFTYFHRLNKKGITFVVVSHNENLKKFLNKTYYINDGILSDKLPS
ncbi:MAG: ABC transporter ATP-binding protein [Aquificae bacterium]|nr:ABC transporter ATP-binding protein [Aquificota bacterium]